MAGTYIKKVRIEYYQVVESNEPGQDRLFDLRKIINKLDDLPLERRKKEYYQDGARLDKIKYNKIMKQPPIKPKFSPNSHFQITPAMIPEMVHGKKKMIFAKNLPFAS